MTILTKFGSSEKKDQLPLVEEARVDVVDSLPEGFTATPENFILIRKKTDARMSHICCLLLAGILITSVGILGGMQMYIELNRPSPHHYKGWCAIPYNKSEQPKLIEPHFRIMSMPPPFLSVNSHDVELLDDLPHSSQLDSPNYLKETFDIGDDFERIIVSDHLDGRHTNILHDFTSNVSGIVDTDRCFVMALNTNLVMPPSVFVSTIQGKSDFDITTVRHIMRAMLPALTELSNMGRFIEKDCSDKPTYKLRMMPEESIRKRRSAHMPTYAKFAQFSGKHIQKIDVDISDLLAYEENLPNKV